MSIRIASFVALTLLLFGGIAIAQEGGESTAEVAADSDIQADSGQGSEEGSSGDEGDHSEEDHSESGSHDGEGDHDEAGHSGGEHGDEHHDNDPTHANMSDQTWGVVDFRTDMAFFSAIVFLLLLFGLSMTAWKPIMDGLEKREEGIASKIANAEKAEEAAAAKLSEYESKLATANQEAQEIVAQARKDAEAAGQKLVAEAQEEAVRQRERATADIESAKLVALGELTNQSTEVAMSLAQRVVGREVKADDHQNLIQEMLSKLPSNN